MNEAQKILQMTNGGLTVFTHYLGEKCLSKTFRNPFRDDSRPSCHLYANKGRYGNGQYYLQDFGDSSFCGNCFTIVGRLCNVNLKTNFREVLQIIDRDLGLGVFEGEKTSHQVLMKRATSFQNKEDSSSITSFEVETQPFQSWEEAYWNQYSIGSSILERFNVKSIKSCTFTKSSGNSFAIYGSKAIPTYGYFFDEGQGLKIYRPKAKNRFMYAGHLPKPYIFGINQLPRNSEFVFITGGEKDVMSLSAHGFPALAFNSETANIPEDILDELSKRFLCIIFLYDTDETGKRESALRVRQYGKRYRVQKLDLPLSGIKSEKDISDFFRLGHTTEELQAMIET